MNCKKFKLIYMATINNITFVDESIELLGYAIADTLQNSEQYLYYYGQEAIDNGIYFKKRVPNTTIVYSFSKKEMDMIYDTILTELVGNEKELHAL